MGVTATRLTSEGADRRGAHDAMSARCAWCTHTLNVAQKWTVGTECNGLVMLFVIILEGGGGLGIMDACVCTKISRFNVLSLFVSTAHMSINSDLLAPGTRSQAHWVVGAMTHLV